MVDVPSTNLVLSSSLVEATFSSPEIAVPSANLVLNGLGPEVFPMGIIIPSANLTLSLFTSDLVFVNSPSIEIPSADLRLSVSTITMRRVVPWASHDDNPALLCPINVSIRLSTETQSPAGRSLTGKKQFVQIDAGFWVIVLENIRINTRQDVLAWRKIEGALNGRANTALIPIPSENATTVATVDVDVDMGAATVFLDVSAGDDPEEGMHFSIGQRLYRIKQIVAQVGSVFELKVLPPVRDFISAGAVAEFASPVCRCRLMRDDGMNITHDLMRISRPTVIFCEDWVQ